MNVITSKSPFTRKYHDIEIAMRIAEVANTQQSEVYVIINTSHQTFVTRFWVFFAKYQKYSSNHAV